MNEERETRGAMKEEIAHFLRCTLFIIVFSPKKIALQSVWAGSGGQKIFKSGFQIRNIETVMW